MAELVDALDLGSSVLDVRVRVSPSALAYGSLGERLSLLTSITLKPKLLTYYSKYPKKHDRAKQKFLTSLTLFLFIKSVKSLKKNNPIAFISKW